MIQEHRRSGYSYQFTLAIAYCHSRFWHNAQHSTQSSGATGCRNFVAILNDQWERHLPIPERIKDKKTGLLTNETFRTI